jgi:hypothetical protein
MSETPEFVKPILCPITMTSDIIDPTLQRQYIVEYMDDISKEDQIAIFRWLESRINDNNLHVCKTGTNIDLNRIHDKLINTLFWRVKVALQ